MSSTRRSSATTRRSSRPGAPSRPRTFDHRGGPPRAQTDDHVATALQILGVFATTRAITTVPLADALLVHHVLPDVSAVPLRDADPAVLSLIWRAEDDHPLVSALVEISGAAEPPPGSTNGGAPK